MLLLYPARTSCSHAHLSSLQGTTRPAQGRHSHHIFATNLAWSSRLTQRSRLSLPEMREFLTTHREAKKAATPIAVYRSQ